MFSSSSVPHLITLNLAKNGAFEALTTDKYFKVINITTFVY